MITIMIKMIMKIIIMIVIIMKMGNRRRGKLTGVMTYI